jgi:hypothetical protein
LDRRIDSGFNSEDIIRNYRFDACFGPSFCRRKTRPSSGSSRSGNGASPSTRHGDPMPVVGHPAVRPNRHPALLAPLGQQLHIGRVVLLAEKRRLAAAAALGHVLRHSRHYHPCPSRHALSLAKRFLAVNNYL